MSTAIDFIRLFDKFKYSMSRILIYSNNKMLTTLAESESACTMYIFLIFKFWKNINSMYIFDYNRTKPNCTMGRVEMDSNIFFFKNTYSLRHFNGLFL